MAAPPPPPLLFYDLSLPSQSPSSGGGGCDGTASSSSQLLAATARALELGYAAVALDHTHRGLLTDSHRCRTQPFPPLSSLPLPSSAALHRRRLASPASDPFRQYTRITLPLDSAAAAASALAPSAARLLRTYDLVAARPLTQLAFDHLCQAPLSALHLDLISIDFSSYTKLPFRIKLPMLKLALQKGLYFEITYSPLVSTDTNAKRNLLAEAKLLVEWTKGKNLIISSAAHTATQIRGPYDVINLSAFLLGLPINRAKAAISTNCRSLISKALKKKYFYKETIRIDRLLPNEQLDSTKFKLDDWIGWNSVPPKGDLQSLVVNQLEPSSNIDGFSGSPIHGVIEGSHKKPHNSDVPAFAKLIEHCGDHENIPSQTEEETLQVEKTEVLIDCSQSALKTSFSHQNAVPEKATNSEVLDCFVQVGAISSVELKSIDKHVEFAQDAMEIDAQESCGAYLTVGDNIHATSKTSINLACSTLPQGKDIELSGTILEDQDPGQSCEILDHAKSYINDHTDYTSSESDNPRLLHEILYGSDIYPDDYLDKPNYMSVDTELYRGASEPVECLPCGTDDKAPLDHTFYPSHKLCKDSIIQQVMEAKIEQIIYENLEQRVENDAEFIDMKTRTTSLVEPTFHGQGISSTSYKRTTDESCKSDELKEENSKEKHASLEKSVGKTHEQLVKFSYPSGKVKMSAIRSEKRRHKLRSHHLAYLPFLGFLRSLHLKKKMCKVRGQIKLA